MKLANARTKKTSNRKKNTTKRKTQASKTQSNLVRVCLLLCGIAISIIALFQFGLVGIFFYHLANILFGSLTVLFYLFFIAICILSFIHFDFHRIPYRYYIGVLFLLGAWLMMEGLHEITNQQSWSVLSSIGANIFNILSGSALTKSGLIGALLIGVFHTLFDSTGCIVLIVLFIILAFSLFGYDSIRALIENKQVKDKTKTKKVKSSKKSKNQQDEVVLNDSLFLDADPKEENLFVADDMDEPAIHTIEADVVEKIEPVTEAKEVIAKPAEYIADEEQAYAQYKLPRISILNELEKKSKNNVNVQSAKQQGQKLMEILHEFGVKATLVQIHIGPSVTKFEVRPELGVRVNRISNLQYDIKMALAAKDIRIEAPIPGKSAVGIEIPNVEKTTVQMKELIKNIPDSLKDKKLLFCLGKDLMGNCVYGELNKMPHLLIAGATGSGKSVCVNSIISSILLRTRPDEVKLVLIDPKKVEFTPYNDVPHLLAPVITDGDLANKALKVIVQIMEHRYDLFGRLGVRNIQSYNEHVLNHPDDSLKRLPRIVVIIDELADLMLVAAKEVESSIQRITQLARAAGIHLIVATQRPSVDVITGVIKANIPSRIAFAVSSSTDSRTILDQSGAERLLGYGDMLYLPNGETSPRRIQGVFIKDEEVNRIAAYVKSQASPHYDDAFIQLKDLQSQGQEVGAECADPLYDQVKNFVIQSRRASTSLIQRKFSVGYSRAARLIDALEDQGIIGPANGSKPRKILVQNTLEDPEE